MYVLWLLGQIGRACTPLVGQNATGGLVKIPGILADVGVAWMLFVICRRWGDQLVSRARERLGEPWGSRPPSTSSTPASSSIPRSGDRSTRWARSCCWRPSIAGSGWTEAAAVGAVLALLVKFQFGFLIPLVAIVGLKRHLVGRSADPEHEGRRDPLRVLTSLAAGVISMALLILPFRPDHLRRRRRRPPTSAWPTAPCAA